MVQEFIGKRIKMYRMAKGWTQEQLAEQVNLSRNFLSAVERGKYAVNLDTLVDIINCLDCSADEIFEDVINEGYKVRASKLSDIISDMPKEEKERILKVVETLVKTAKKN